MNAVAISQWARWSDAQLRLIWDNALDGKRLTNEEGTILMVNEAFCRLVEKSREMLEGQLISVVYEPNRRDEVMRKHRERFYQRSVPKHLERELTLWNGKNVVFELSNTFLEMDGQPTLLVTTFRDISERKQAERRMAWLASFPERNPNPVIEMDPVSGTIHYLNPFATQLFPDLRNRPFDHPWLADLREAAKPLLDRSVDVVRREIQVGASFYAQTIEYIPETNRVRIYSSDITQGKEAEAREAALTRLAQRLSAVDSAMAAANIITDTADALIGWDACSLDLYLAEQDLMHPLINIDLVNGQRVVVHSADADKPPSPLIRRIFKEGAQLILRREPYGFSEEAIPFGDLTTPSKSLLYVPIRLREKSIGVLSIQSYKPQAYDQQDLTVLQALADQCSGALERVRVQEALRQLNEELENRVARRTAQLQEANKELEAFSYSVSHDLRAPLRGVDGYSRLLLDDYGPVLDEEGKRILGVIRGEAQRMGRLIDALLNFSRLGRQQLKSSTLDMTTMARVTFEGLMIGHAGPRPQLELHPLPRAQGDESLIRQVFVNLLANAIKFTRHREGARIEVGSTTQSEQNVYYVQDNGVGFDSKYSNKLFGVFQRLHHEDEFEGTGVGLALVQRIVSRHGGRIWAAGNLNEGAAFYFTLPSTQDNP